MMSNDPLVEALAFIKRCVRQRRLFWTYHVNMRLQGRSISRQMIQDAVDSLEIIEAYPDDKYLPSYLVLACAQGDMFHILFSIDTHGDNVRVVTAYRPDPGQWSADLKRRQ